MADRHVQAPPQRHQHHQRQVYRQRMKLMRDADAERRGDGVAVQRPKMRVGQPVAEHAQVPLVAARMTSDESRLSLLDAVLARHRAATLAAPA